MRKYNRGLFIVFEGLDKSGKSTQTQLMAKKLNAKTFSFPDRSTQLGKMISDYLQNKNNMRDEVIHLLFSANRWEKNDMILECLRQGTNIVSDRYAYSGVAFSAAKGLPLQWCKDSDHGLPKPDFTFYLRAPIVELCQRDEFGQERYENQVFQNKVGEIFDQMAEENGFFVIDALKPKDVILNEALTIISNNKQLEDLKFL